MKRNDLVFVVDDDPIFSELLIDKLEERGFTSIETFFSGESCIKEIHRKPALILLDYNLHGEKGIETLKNIVSYDSNIPVVFVSGQDDIQNAVDTLRYGAFDYITKNNGFLMKLDATLHAIRRAQELVSKPNRLGRFFFGML